MVDGFRLGKKASECYQNDEHSAHKKLCCEMNEDVRKHNVSCISDLQFLECKLDAEDISKKPDSDKIKKGKENTLERNKLNKEVNTAIVNFKNIVANGPSYICSCCTQTWFREGVLKTESLQSSLFAKSYLLNLKSAENSEWVCLTCYRYLKSGENTSMLSSKWIFFSRKTPTVRNNRNGRAPYKSTYSFHANYGKTQRWPKKFAWKCC